MDIGFNFRNTGTTGDGANETYVIGTARTYPQSRLGVTFGTLSYRGAFDIGWSGGDGRLRGVFWHDSTVLDFRVDVTPGSYEMYIGAGVSVQSTTPTYDVFDDAALIYSVSAAVPSSQNIMDAAGNVTTAAAWATGNSAVTVNISSGVFRIRSQAVYSGLAHLRLVSIAATPNRRQQRSQQIIS